MDSDNSGEVTEKDILEFAIEIEKSAAEFFDNAANNVGDPKARAILLDLADEERSHEAKLKKLLGKVEASEPMGKSYFESDLKEISVFEAKLPETDDSTVGDIMRYAMKREKAAMELYETFSHLLKAGEFRDLCLHLANEEREHLAEFEMLYDSSKKS